MARRYSIRDLKLLWGLAAARCAFPECRQELFAEESAEDSAVVLGEIAHIVASGDEGPRADPDFPSERRDSYENLILLCPNHHTLVDKQEGHYAVERLRNWKSEHERWVREQLRHEMPNVSFAELEVLTRGLLNAPEPSSEDFKPLDPAEKMEKNDLTQRVHHQLTLGLSKAKEVGDFLASFARVDPDFPERIKAGFVQEYRQLSVRGVEGDALFEALRDFAAMGRRDFRYQAAGLTVLCYLFEACEVFEQ